MHFGDSHCELVCWHATWILTWSLGQKEQDLLTQRAAEAGRFAALSPQWSACSDFHSRGYLIIWVHILNIRALHVRTWSPCPCVGMIILIIICLQLYLTPALLISSFH